MRRIKIAAIGPTQSRSFYGLKVVKNKFDNLRKGRPMIISGRQALAARLLLKMDKNDVSARINTLKRILGSFESKGRPMGVGRLDMLQDFFENNGIEFTLGGVKIRDYISNESMAPTPEQCRAARGLLACSMEKLAAHAGLSTSVVFCLENGGNPSRTSAAKLLGFFDAEKIEMLPGGARDLEPERFSIFRGGRALK